MQGRKSRLRAFLPRWGSEREPGLRPGPLPRERADADRGFGFLFRHFKIHFHSLPLILSFIPAISQGPGSRLHFGICPGSSASSLSML